MKVQIYYFSFSRKMSLGEVWYDHSLLCLNCLIKKAKYQNLKKYFVAFVALRKI